MSFQEDIRSAPNRPSQEEVCVLCRVPRDQICRFRYTLESYEGLCVPTTLPGGGGLVRLSTSWGLLRELEEVLVALSGEMDLVVVGSGREEPAG